MLGKIAAALTFVGVASAGHVKDKVKKPVDTPYPYDYTTDAIVFSKEADGSIKSMDVRTTQIYSSKFNSMRSENYISFRGNLLHQQFYFDFANNEGMKFDSLTNSCQSFPVDFGGMTAKEAIDTVVAKYTTAEGDATTPHIPGKEFEKFHIELNKFMPMPAGSTAPDEHVYVSKDTKKVEYVEFTQTISGQKEDLAIMMPAGLVPYVAKNADEVKIQACLNADVVRSEEVVKKDVSSLTKILNL